MSQAHLPMLLLLFTISLTGCYTTFFADDDLYSSSSSRAEHTESSETTIVIDEYFVPAPHSGTSWLWGSFWYDPWFDPFFASPWAPVSVGWWSPYWRWSWNVGWGWSPYWAWSGWGWQPGWSWVAPYPSSWIWVPTAPTAQAPLLRPARPFGRLRSTPFDNERITPLPQIISVPASTPAPDASDTRRVSSSSEGYATPNTPATEKRIRPAVPSSYVLPYRSSTASPAYRVSSPTSSGERRIQSERSAGTGSTYSSSGTSSGASSGSGSSGTRSSGRSRN